MDQIKPILTVQEMQRMSAEGNAIYRRKLQALLEPDHEGEEVAIHLVSEDFEVGPRRARPAIGLRRRHPEGGMIMTRVVGPPRPDDSLSLRVMAGLLVGADPSK